MRDAEAFFTAEGYQVIPVPEGIRLWDEDALGAWAGGLGELEGVIHPAPPLFQCAIEAADEALYARSRDEGPVAAWCVTKVLGALLRRQRRGSLIYVGSVHAEKPVGYGFLFSAGCGATQMLNREVSQDYGPDGVRCYYIQRGPGRDDPVPSPPAPWASACP